MQYFTRFGFTRDPFSLSPDPALFHPSDGRAECLRQLEEAVRERRGLTLVTGRAGTGKTILLRRFTSRLAAVVTVDVLFLPEPDFASPRALLEHMHIRLTGQRPDASLSEGEILDNVAEALEKNAADGRRTVLIVDEAQRMGVDCLDVILQLLGGRGYYVGPLQVALFGRPELGNAAERFGVEPLVLGPLTRRETEALIALRLDRAKGQGEPRPRLFSRCALRAVHNAARGNPGRVVRLCRSALSALVATRSDRITARLVRRQVREEAGRDKGRRVFGRVGFACPGFGPGLAMVLAVFLAAGAGILVRYVPSASNVLTGLNRAAASVEAPAGQVLALPDSASAVRGDPPDGRPPSGGLDVERPHHFEGLPETLGVIRLLPGESVRDLVRGVYGADDPAVLRLVSGANPHLGGDLGQASAGSAVRFPAQRDVVSVPPAGSYWVGLSTHDDLERAYAALRQYRYFGLECRILASWSVRDGLVLLVTLTEPYPDRAAALGALADLPLSLQSAAEPWNPALMGFVVVGALDVNGTP